MNGNIKGTVIATSTFEGKWSANAKNNSFKATVTTAGNYGNDKLAKNFIEGLNAATSYEGEMCIRDRSYSLQSKPKSCSILKL